MEKLEEEEEEEAAAVKHRCLNVGRKREDGKEEDEDAMRRTRRILAAAVTHRCLTVARDATPLLIATLGLRESAATAATY